jgi:hypothetical protein
MRGVAQIIWPQSKVDCLGPAGTHVEPLLACALLEVMDGLLGNAILEVHVHATKGELLLHVVTCLLEGVVMELPAVAVVVEVFHSMFVRILLKGKFGGKCLCQQIVGLKVNKAEMAVVVNGHGNGGTLVALLGKFPFQLHVKSHFGGCHLVDRDAFSWLGGNEHLLISLGFLPLPGKLGHHPQKVACALGR